MDPLLEYLNALIYLGIAAFIGVAMLLLGALLGPRRPGKTKLAAYESGNEPLGYAKRFPAHFYGVGMLFILFDVEVAFLWPYAVAAGRLGLAGFAAALLFTLVLLLGLLYEWRKGVMKWDR
jgi:NADH-quinone oxidoreductase subunit A